MSYQNFIPAQWASAIERDLEKLHVYAEDTNRKYEGVVAEAGDSVKILGIGKPTIKHIDRANSNDDIDGAEIIEDQSDFMPINQIAYFNYMIGDIDKRQAKGGLDAVLSQETSEELADDVDMYLANLVKTTKGVKLITGAANAAITLTKDNIRSTIDEAVKWLYTQNVKRSTKLVATLSPAAYMLLKEAVLNLDTDNSKLLKNGYVGQYGNVYIKMTNNVAKDASGNELLHVKTQRAISYVHAHTHTEPYRPEKKFADAIKGFILYDAKITRMKEICALKVTY